MFTGFAKAELLSILYPELAILHNQLTTGNSVNTYDAGQVAAGIDTWQSGNALFRNCLMLINVSEATAGTLTITLRDSGSAITTANGAASTQLAATLATISAVGLYYAEFQFTHVFASTLARVVTSEDNASIRRHHSVRGTAAGGTFSFSVINIYGFNARDYPTQTADALAITWAAT